MSVLSKKWRCLWKYYQNLVFVRETMFSSGNNSIQNRGKFIRNVNSVLRQLRSTTLKKFVVRFRLRKPQTHHVDRWVSFAAMSKARCVIFDFSPGSSGDDIDSRCIFPPHHFSGSSGSPVRSLHLMFLCLMPLPDFHGFTNLKKLKLDSVLIPGHLYIVRCTLHGLQASQPLVRLRYLHVQECSGMEKVQLQAPNLATFKFHNRPMAVVLNGCLNISEATIVALVSSYDCFDYALTQLPSGIPHVQKHNIEFTMETKIFRNHDHTGGIHRLAYLLELAPILEQLELHRPHNRLKVLNMTGVYGYKSLLDLALYIARNATALQRMVIDPMAKRSSFLLELKSTGV
ncbi:hypothetical protein BS78_10G030000 [Paspalum vaginatum]|nr:hypothetical protein BS78_10G030000 [Paspalum vaginatum]